MVLPKRTKIVFIVNPISGYGKQRLIENQVPKYLDKSFDIEIAYTEAPKHATVLAKKAVDANADIVVAVGGDGSINEVSRGIIGSDTKMGIIPMGSGNGLARFLNIPRMLSQSVAVIKEGYSRPVDTLYMNGESFVNVGGVGFDAHISHRFAQQGSRGFISYLRPSLLDLMSFSPYEYNLEVDGEFRAIKAFTISFANSSQYGNNAHIAPGAVIDDGYFEVAVISPFPKIFTAEMGLRLFTKTIDKSRFIHIIRAKTAKISASKNLKAHIDGEPMEFGKQIEIGIKPLSLNIVMPKHEISPATQITNHILHMAGQLEPRFRNLALKRLYF